VHRVVNTVFAFLDLNLGGTTDADHGHAASEFGQPLLQRRAFQAASGDHRLRKGAVVKTTSAML